VGQQPAPRPGLPRPEREGLGRDPPRLEPSPSTPPTSRSPSDP
jgi:hypothetical protein